jgi:hypothetical protein
MAPSSPEVKQCRIVRTIVQIGRMSQSLIAFAGILLATTVEAVESRLEDARTNRKCCSLGLHPSEIS